jgi:membrane-associated phospholipid phosphatase
MGRIFSFEVYMKILRRLPAAALAAFIGSIGIFSQMPTPSPPLAKGAGVAAQTSPSPSPSPKVNFFRDVAHDEGKAFTSLFHLHGHDFRYLAPLALGTAAFIATDKNTSGWVSRNGSLPAVSRWVSYGGSIYGTGGLAAGFYLVGAATHDDRARETGRLSAEALVDTIIITEVLKYGMGRKRPDFGTGEGHFFDHGNSFPSGHSSSAWAVATVVSLEYRHHPLVKYGALAAAAIISMSRYTGRNHFLSDVVVGSAIGYGMGRLVYDSHH